MPVPASRPALHVELDAPLPDELAVGNGTALFVCGWCVSATGRIERLELVVDGAPSPVERHGMPRLDVFRALHPHLDPFAARDVHEDPASDDDPGMHGYRSGFWGTAAVPAAAGPRCRIVLRATLADGRVEEAELTDVPVRSAPAPATLPGGTVPRLAVCMATYEPDAALLGAQLDSIRAQTHDDWVCLISDDCSGPAGTAVLQAATAGDPRFVVSRSAERLGFYRNFERALGLVPPGVAHVALADQDDVWFPEKLATLEASIGDARLVYSDARVVAAAVRGPDAADAPAAGVGSRTPQGHEVLADTYWEVRRNNHVELTSLLVANAVTGAASLMRGDLLDDVLPFPPAQFAHFHDHWIGLVACARGPVRGRGDGIAYVDRPLYDYVQHGEASLGHAAANQMPRLRDRLGGLRRDPKERVGLWRMHYFVDVARLTQLATMLRLRLGGAMPRRERRAVDRFLRADRSLPALAAFWARGARELVGRPETLGAEWMLGYALAWRRALTASTRDRPVKGLRLDAVPPPSLAPRPGRSGPGAPVVREIGDKVAPLSLAVRDDAPARVNLLVPAIDLDHFFGGYIAKFNLARRLAERGLRVRIVTIDPQPPLPSAWQRRLEAFAGLEGLFDRVEVAFGREGALPCSREDRFVASTWWSAHVAHAAARTLAGGAEPEPFLYLVQEYEPFTFPMGTYAALAAESYGLPHVALFSTELLRGFFRRHGYGVYTAGTDAGDAASASFQNAITAVDPPTAEALAGRTSRRLLFYARPEPHAARNLFELGTLALARALQTGVLRGGWELHGIGTVAHGRRIDLGGGAALELLPRAAQGDYARVLREHDVGLSLMYTPHPSLVPIEMASAGMVTVTNRFENKTPEAMAAISTNLVTTSPTVEGVVDGIAHAVAGVGDAEARARGAVVAWSRDWDESLHDGVIDRVVAWLAEA